MHNTNYNINSLLRLCIGTHIIYIYATRYLRVPSRGGHRRSLASHVNQQFREASDRRVSKATSSDLQPSSRDPNKSWANRVSTKLEEGNFKGAVRLACSKDTISPYNDSTLNALKQKHPPPHPDCNFPPSPVIDPIKSIKVSSEDVVKAILSFPCGSAGGPDGLHPQHLKDMTGPSAGTGGLSLIEALTSFINLTLQGKTPAAVHHFFFGASLVALDKPDGGVRPIAVGCTLRRLVSKCACRHVKEAMSSLLSPLQLGFGIPLGAEAAAHAARLYLQNLLPGYILLKLDFMNAFNSIRRDKVFATVNDMVPELLPLVYSAYSKPSSLFFGDKIVQSCEGVQQGDLLGPLLFCLAIHRMTKSLTSEFKVFYLDDGTLGGQLDDVLHDLKEVERQAEELGLRLNREKCELIGVDDDTLKKSLSMAPGLRIVDPEFATLLGSPIGNVEGIEEVIETKTNALRDMGRRLQHLQAHDALCLLKHAFALPKLLYTLRSAPCFLSTKLQDFDAVQCSILSEITNVDIGVEDQAWSQASLPVKFGGLGVRSAAMFAHSAFLASAAGASTLVQQLLPARLQAVTNTTVEKALEAWKQGHNKPPPPVSESSKQKSWDTPHVETCFDSILESAPDATACARIEAAARPESGAWLHALPVSSLGLRMDDEVVRVATGLRLGVSLCHPHKCHQCGAQVDHLAVHGLSCRRSQGCFSRHTAINDIIKRSLATAKVPPLLEPSGISQSDGKRPDGATTIPWERGRILVWDATCPDTFAPSHSSIIPNGPGAVANRAERQKMDKYKDITATHLFVPIGIETTGVLGSEARNFLHELAQ